MRPFFSYYGSKWRLAPKYPAPIYDHIIEPFAGSAQYATLYYDRKITLVDKNEKVCGVWDYLIRSKPSDIMALPNEVYHIDDFPNLCQEAKWLIGFWLNSASVQPCYQMSKWGNQKNGGRWWNEKTKRMIVLQQPLISHWQTLCEDYTNLLNPQATWFIDPPYDNNAGKIYPYQIDSYRSIACWALSRTGQVIVCENYGSTWLPFDYLGHSQSAVMRGNCYVRQSHEMLYHKENTQC